MSILTIFNGYEHYKLIDDATRQEIARWVWVDDEDLLYAFSRYGLPDLTVKVTAVSVNHSAREIHVNTPPAAVIASTVSVGRATPAATACDECCDSDRCRRIGQCLRFKWAFGDAQKP